jgi:glycosyltransferase involved in cell wall biosynthesis
MRILVAAIACQPKGGSEGYVGWSCVNAISMDHEVHVITSRMCQKEIEAELVTHPRRSQMTFSFVGEPIRWHENRLIARLQSWIAYRKWVDEAKRVAKQLCSKQQFDVLHHVTYATWRMGTPLAGLGRPLIFGPVGGGEKFPFRFFSMLSPIARWFEIARTISGWIAAKSKNVRQAAQTANLLLANNHETEELLEDLGAQKEKIKLMSQSFLSPERMASLKCVGPKGSSREKLVIFAGGNLEGRKGVAIALEALASLVKWDIPFEFTYGGSGPELRHLLQIAGKLSLPSDAVKIGVILEGGDYLRALKDAHIYLLPSLREGAPVTMIEAMAASCVPMVGSCGGAAMLVTQDCGRLISITTPNQMALEIAAEIKTLWSSPGLLEKLGSAAVERVASRCSESFYRELINGHYQSICGKN